MNAPTRDKTDALPQKASGKCGVCGEICKGLNDGDLCFNCEMADDEQSLWERDRE